MNKLDKYDHMLLEMSVEVTEELKMTVLEPQLRKCTLLQWDFVHFDHAPNPLWNDQFNCWTGHPNYAYLIEWSADCNGDGIVDYGQILDGTVDDLDQNGVPDCCNAGDACDPPCPGDLSGDGLVDSIDLGLLLALWGTDGQNNPQADIDGDGVVDSVDLGLVLSGWGVCPQG